jgi:hypothetical protein
MNFWIDNVILRFTSGSVLAIASALSTSSHLSRHCFILVTRPLASESAGFVPRYSPKSARWSNTSLPGYVRLYKRTDLTVPRHVRAKSVTPLLESFRNVVIRVYRRGADDGDKVVCIFMDISYGFFVLDFELCGSHSSKKFYPLEYLRRTCKTLRHSPAPATAALGPQIGRPSNAFSATFNTVRKAAICFAALLCVLEPEDSPGN